ncbi:hypothetical protein LRP88_07152 [Fusarium phalaenopsidis]
MGSISVRKWIRWVPEEASEPTSTLVLTSPGRHFVDLRIYLPEGHQGPWTGQHDPLPLSRLEWGIAGVSISTKRPDSTGKLTSYSAFHQWISSRTLTPELFSDAGFMYPQPNDLTLEKGSMLNPDTGVEGEYEELWHDVDPTAVPDEGGVRVLVLQLHDDEHRTRGSVVRLGRHMQGFVRVGDEVALERWEWDEGWKRTVKIGEIGLPCEKILKGENLSEGDVVDVEGKPWMVVEGSGRRDTPSKL